MRWRVLGGLEAVVDGGGFHPGGGTLSKSCETWAERFCICFQDS